MLSIYKELLEHLLNISSAFFEHLLSIAEALYLESQYYCLLCSINFKQYEPPQKEVPANSEVLKALLEHENQETRGVAGLPEFQENRTSNFFLAV